MITDTSRLNFLLAEGAFKDRAQIDNMMVKAAAHEPGEPVQPATNDEARPPLRFCVRCLSPIDPKRVMRGSCFDTNECRKDDLKERRAFRASKACRLCGRPARRKTTPNAASHLCDSSTSPETTSQQQPATEINHGQQPNSEGQ